MKIIGFLLLSLISVVASGQYYASYKYPKWFVEDIPFHQGNPDEFNTITNDPAPVKTISLSTGVKLEYVEQGDPNGIPVILLHGFPDSWRSYEQVLKFMPKALHVFSISQRGFGNSDRPEKGYFPTHFADDLAAFIKMQKLPPAVIVGHSLGATVTMQFSLSYPELVRGIALEGTMVSFDDKENLVEAKAMIDQTRDPIDIAAVREFQQSTLAKPISEEFFNTLINESMKTRAHVWKEVFDGLWKTANFRKRIAQVNKPALIIWGDKDGYGPRADQELLAAAIKGAKLVVYEGTGHSLHWEEPSRFAKDLVTFIEAIKK